jgi:hypothetical protein
MQVALSIGIAAFLWGTFLYEVAQPWIRGEW